MSIAAFIKLLTCVESIALAFLCVKKDPNNKHNILFAFYVFCIAAASFIEYQTNSAMTEQEFLFWKNFDIFIYFAVASILHFALIYTEHMLGKKKYCVVFIYILFGIIAVFDITKIIPAQLVLTPWGYASIYHPSIATANNLIMIATSIIAFLPVILFIRYYFKVKDQRVKTQALFFIVSFSFLVFYGICTEIILPIVMHARVPFSLTVTSAFIVVNPIFAFAIIRYNVLKISHETIIGGIVQMMSDALILTDDTGIIQYGNQSAYMLLQMHENEFISKNIKNFIYQKSSDAHGIYQYSTIAIDKSINDHGCFLKAKNDAYIPVSLSISVLKKSYWGPEGIIFVIRDIRERKKHEEIKEGVEKILRHDLKNPLNVIHAIPDVLLVDKNLTENQQEGLLIIKKACRQILNQIDVYFNLQKIENGTFKYNPHEVDVLDILNNVIMQHKNLVNQKKCEISVIVDSKMAVPGVTKTISTEETLFSNMFSNLLKNALEASPRGEQITVTITSTPHFSLSVHNFGTIPEEIRSRFFSKYVTSGKEYGTGLGAYSAKLIAGVIGGIIAFQTDDTKGTTLTVAFPHISA